MNYSKLFDWRRLAGRKRWALPAAALAAFAAGVFLLSLRYLFPYADVAHWIESRCRSAGYEAHVEALGPGPLLGVRAPRMTIAPADDPERKTELRNVTVRLSVASLLRLRPRAVVEADAMGGSLETGVTLREPRQVEARWQDLDLNRAPFAPGVYALGLGGRFTGTMQATLPPRGAGAGALAGSLEGRIAGARLGPGSLHGLPLPGVSLGAGSLQLKAVKGRVEVSTARFEGGNLDLSFAGDVALAQGQQPAAVQGLLTVRPRGRTEEDLGFLLAFLPGPRASDGTYAARVSGSPGALVLSQVTAAR